MRKSKIVNILLLIVIAASVLYGCMDTEGSPVSVNGQLTSRHSGWMVNDCLSCHPAATMYKSPEAIKAHNGAFTTIDYNACYLCHGGNGLMTDEDFGKCTSCHSASSPIAQVLNVRFDKSHPGAIIKEPYRCINCHTLTGHPDLTTELKPMEDKKCMQCHDSLGHGVMPGCTAGTGCHEQVTGFTRGEDKRITGHDGGGIPY